jgi:hypothetical protein
MLNFKNKTEALIYLKATYGYPNSEFSDRPFEPGQSPSLGVDVDSERTYFYCRLDYTCNTTKLK